MSLIAPVPDSASRLSAAEHVTNVLSSSCSGLLYALRILRTHGMSVQSRFAETRFAETLTLTLTLNPNFGESGFGETGRHRHVCYLAVWRFSSYSRCQASVLLTSMVQILFCCRHKPTRCVLSDATSGTVQTTFPIYLNFLDVDDQLFSRTSHNVTHVLKPFLPTDTQHFYNLRERHHTL